MKYQQRFLWALLAGCFFVSDQVSKYFAVTKLQLGEPIPIVYGLNLTLEHNTGIAFGLFAEHPMMQTGLLLGITLLLSAALCWWFFCTALEEKRTLLALSALLGGALGNVVDRLQFGYVVDFIQVYAGQWYWPVFNVADSCICVGACAIALGTWKKGAS